MLGMVPAISFMLGTFVPSPLKRQERVFMMLTALPRGQNRCGNVKELWKPAYSFLAVGKRQVEREKEDVMAQKLLAR